MKHSFRFTLEENIPGKTEEVNRKEKDHILSKNVVKYLRSNLSGLYTSIGVQG